MKQKINILFGAPPEWLGTGIASAASGIKAAFQCLSSDITVIHFDYVRPKGKWQKMVKIFLEINDLIVFAFKMLFHRADIVHIQSTLHFKNINIQRDFIYLFTTRLLRKKFILHAHGGEWDKINEWSKFWQYVTKLFLTSCDRVIVTSLDEQKIIDRIYAGKVRVCTIYNPVVFPIRITENSNPLKLNTVKKIIFASRLIAEKGVLEVIHAASYLDRRNDFQILIFGKGILLEESRTLILTLNLQDKILLMGEVALPQLIEQYLNADLFLFPSYYGEGFPMALFYAVLCGLPIITTKVRAVSDFLSEPENCLWVEPKNPKLIAEKINYLLDNHDLTARMKKNNRELSVSFSPEKISHEFLALYRSLVHP